LSSSALDKVLDYFKSKELNEVEKDKIAATVAAQEIQAELETRKLQKDIIATEQGWWVTAWIRPMIVYPFILHIAAITLDSTFKLGWGIAKLPEPYEYMEQTIILSYFLTRPFEKVSRSVISYLRSKSN